MAPGLSTSYDSNKRKKNNARSRRRRKQSPKKIFNIFCFTSDVTILCLHHFPARQGTAKRGLARCLLCLHAIKRLCGVFISISFFTLFPCCSFLFCLLLKNVRIGCMRLCTFWNFILHIASGKDGIQEAMIGPRFRMAWIDSR